MENFLEPLHDKKRRRSTNAKESKAHGIVEETGSGLPNEVPSTSNGSKRLKKQDDCWPNFLSEAELDMLVSIKKLAMERFTSLKEDSLQEILPASVLRTIGILTRELVKDHVRKLVSVHKSSQVSKASQGSKEVSGREL